MIDLERQGEIAILRLDHGRANVLDLELAGELLAAFAQLESGPERAVVLTGSGRSFSAGVDLVRVVEGGAGYVRSFLPALGDMIERVFFFPKPLVAAINGHAIAGGCLLACAADRRLMSDSGGGIGVPELAVGVPFPAVALEILRLSVPALDAHRLVWSGRILDAAEAAEVGLIDELAPAGELLARALRAAETLAAIPAASFAVTKRQLRAPARERLAAAGGPVGDEVAEVWTRPEILEAVAAYVERTLKKRA